MLTHDELVDLYRTHRKDRVLTVYLNGRATDFAERSAWRRRFEQGVGETRKRLQGAGGEEEATFNKALEHVKGAISGFDQFLPGNGFVAFATPEGLVHASAIRVPMPDLVRWEDGIRVAPYVRALKQERPVVMALVDSRRARIFEYKSGELTEPVSLNAETFLGDLSDINVSKRPTAHSGVRGKTGTDAAQKALGTGSDRMMKQLAEQVRDRMGKSGHLVLGGTSEAVAHIRGALPGNMNGRMIEQTSLRVEMTDSEARDALEKAASELNQRNQEKLLEEVENQAKSGGRGALGAEGVEKALREARVDTLLLSRGFIHANPDYADHLVGAAFEQHAEVEELSLNGASRLDTEGEGIAARLRYTL